MDSVQFRGFGLESVVTVGGRLFRQRRSEVGRRHWLAAQYVDTKYVVKHDTARQTMDHYFRRQAFYLAQASSPFLFILASLASLVSYSISQSFWSFLQVSGTQRNMSSWDARGVVHYLCTVFSFFRNALRTSRRNQIGFRDGFISFVCSSPRRE